MVIWPKINSSDRAPPGFWGTEKTFEWQFDAGGIKSNLDRLLPPKNGGVQVIRLLHLADLHLGWEPKYLSDDKKRIRRKERDMILQKAVDYALAPENGVQGVLIVGDLFERYDPETALVREAMHQISRLTVQGMMVVTVPGNHDEITYRESVYRNRGADWPGFLVTNPMPAHCLSQVIKGAPVHIYSLAYTGGLTRAAEIDAFPRFQEPGFHIGAYHGSLDWEGLGDRSLPLTSSKLARAGYNYIALGHYHQFSSKGIGDGLAVYPGAVEFKTFSDPGSGHFTVVSWDGIRVTIENPQVDSRPIQRITLDISSADDFESVKSLCLAYAGPETMSQLSLVGTPCFHIDEDRLLEEIDSEFFYLELRNSAQYFSADFLDEVANEPTVRGEYVKRLRKEMMAADDNEKKLWERAMLLGLQALEGGKRR